MKPARLWSFVTLGVLVAVWVALTWGETPLVQDLFLPPPGELWDAFVDLVQNGYKGRSLAEHIGLSLQRVLLGSMTGAVAGIALGLAMGTLSWLDALADPWIAFLRPLPQLAYLVLLIVWFGIGEMSRVILLFLAALPVCAIAARAGVLATRLQRVQVAQALGASRWQVFRYVVLPSALPEIVSGTRLAVGIVYATLIAAEIIAGSSGIGWMILDAGRFLRSDYVFVGILLIGMMGLALDAMLLAAERFVVHWAGR